jgi:dephospho-CoA kinase
MITIGITGGIGSGKSTVCHLFSAMNFPVYIADIESRRLTETDSRIRKGLIALFGEELFKNNVLNKKMLADEIFNNPEKLALVNGIIHPIVTQDLEKWKQKHINSPIAVLETAILFETGLNKKVDKSIVVISPIDLRIKRIIERDHIAESDVRKRIANQMSDEEKTALADYVIYNDEKRSIIQQVNEIVNKLT